MNITRAIEAYERNSRAFTERFTAITSKVEQPSEKTKESFTDILEDSLRGVNDLQIEKSKAIEDFASGKNNNVHDLMIAMQRASTAVQLTTAVRNKVLEIYQELSQMQL